MKRLSNKQIDRVSEISGNLSLLIMGSIVFPTLTGQTGADIITMIFGLSESFIFFLFSLVILRKN